MVELAWLWQRYQPGAAQVVWFRERVGKAGRRLRNRFDKEKSPEAGRKSDAKTGGGYTDVKLLNGKPEFMHKSGVPANGKGGTYYVARDGAARLAEALDAVESSPAEEARLSTSLCDR